MRHIGITKTYSNMAEKKGKSHEPIDRFEKRFGEAMNGREQMADSYSTLTPQRWHRMACRTISRGRRALGSWGDTELKFSHSALWLHNRNRRLRGGIGYLDMLWNAWTLTFLGWETLQLLASKVILSHIIMRHLGTLPSILLLGMGIGFNDFDFLHIEGICSSQGVPEGVYYRK